MYVPMSSTSNAKSAGWYHVQVRRAIGWVGLRTNRCCAGDPVATVNPYRALESGGEAQRAKDREKAKGRDELRLFSAICCFDAANELDVWLMVDEREFKPQTNKGPPCQLVQGRGLAHRLDISWELGENLSCTCTSPFQLYYQGYPVSHYTFWRWARVVFRLAYAFVVSNSLIYHSVIAYRGSPSLTA